MSETPRVLRGIAAVIEMLDCIGNCESDRDVARILVDNELEIRDLIRFGLQRLK